MLTLCGLVAVGCGGGTGEDDPVGAAAARVTTPSSLPRLADGTVPWVEWPAPDDAFQFEPAVRREPPAGVEPCAADDLEGRLDKWFVKGDNDEGEPRTTANGLFGLIAVRNVSDDACTLQGEVPARLLSAGRPAPVNTEHAVNDEARDRTTTVLPGGQARLRIDWSAPYCGPDVSDQSIELDLPDDGGVVVVPVEEPLQPACTSSETHPDLSSVFSSGAFDVMPERHELDSPFNAVTASIEPPSGEVPLDSTLIFHVTLTNPTETSIPFDPRPGYVIELLAVGDETREPVTDRSVQFLNTVTISELPTGPTRFEMQMPLPVGLEAGRDVHLNWRLLHRALAPTDQHTGAFRFRTV
jgi:hypothetical protein